VTLGTDIGAVAGALGEVAKTVGDVVEAENTPEVVAGRVNAAEQAAQDRLAQDAAKATASPEAQEQFDRDLS
jgi:hypothetical protein